VRVATEAKALARSGEPTGAPPPGARRVPGLPGVHQVPVGAVLDLEPATGGATPHRTWAPPHSRRIMTEDAAVEAVRATLRRAVERRLPGAVRPLVVLAGGEHPGAVSTEDAVRTVLEHRRGGA
jgi:(carboxyethyl)arginine beta-lactam-synthase